MPGTIPKDKYINIATVSSDIDNCIESFLTLYGIDRDYKSIVNVKHQTINAMMIYIYDSLFKPDTTLCNNQRSLVDYNNIELLQVLADKFINICLRFNKSLGLLSFGYMIGCSYNTLLNWLSSGSDTELSSKRLQILKSLQECHKASQVALLNDTPVGALAVANNDNETGLNWSRQQALEQANNAVYLIPSERLNKLGIDKSTQEMEPSVTQV